MRLRLKPSCEPTIRLSSWAFTLAELLVVIAIIGVLVTLLVPALNHTKLYARDRHCLMNFKYISHTFHDYIEDQGVYPPNQVRELDPSSQQWKRKSVTATIGGVNPAPTPYNIQYCQATNRPLYAYQGNERYFRCPMDQGTCGDLDWPLPIDMYDKPTSWETAGCSYLYNASLQGMRDKTRSPPLPSVTLLTNLGTIALKTTDWVRKPAKFILMNEPPAVIRMQRISPTNAIPWWTQWHRNRLSVDFRDPNLAAPLYISPILFVDGHAAMLDFSGSLMTDPYYPYEETPDWQWYQPK